jgi:uncharacterized membrane protein
MPPYKGQDKNKKKPGLHKLKFFESINLELLKRDILIIIILSIITKLVLVFLRYYVFYTYFDLFDTTLYFNYAVNVLHGMVPYVDFSVEYPQLFFVAALLPLLPAVIVQDANAYVPAFRVLMSLFDILTAVLVYLIAIRLFDQKKALLSGILYAASFASTYFVITKYDPFPTFLLMFSIFLFIYGKELGGYFTSGIGFLAKWFPAILLPYYLMFDLKRKRNKNEIIRALLFTALGILIIILPFLLLNYTGFLDTYSRHIGRSSEAFSLIFYVDFILNNLAGLTRSFEAVSIFLMLIIQVLFIWYYWKFKNAEYKTLCSFIFFSIFIFVIFNKVFSPQYMLWLTPFFALFLADSLQNIGLFFLNQIWLYLEFPVLFKEIYYTDSFYTGTGNVFFSAPFVFFTIKYLLLLLIFIIIFKKMENNFSVPGARMSE